MSFPRMNSIRVGASGALAVVVTVGLVIVPPARKDLPTETHQIQLSAAIVSAAANSARFDLGTPPAAASSMTAAVVAADAQELTPVAATEEENFWASPLGTVLIAVNFLVLPIWFLLTPITLPLAMFAAAAAVPEEVGGSLGSLLFLAATGIGFLTGPLGVLNYFMMGLEPSTPAGASASIRGDKALPAPVRTTTETSPPAEVAAEEIQTTPSADQTASAGARASARSAASHIGTNPRAAAAMQAGASVSNDVGVEAAAGVASDAGEGVPQSDAAERNPSSAADAPNGKSNARAHSRR